MWIDENVKRVPWYAPRPNDGQTRSEVDLSFAPTEMKMVGPSPEAARATKYSDYPVSYGLGLVDVSIPLYVVKSHSLSLPISLCYDSGGIRVDDFSGPVGLGWTLEAGGVITRSVSGEEDESTYGWANRWEEDPIDPTFNEPDYLAELADGTRDTSADLFSYNFCGHKGSFYIDWLSDSLNVIPTSATDLIIEVTIDGFLITDTDGTQYSFTQSERSVRNITASEPVPGVGTSSSSPAYLNPITAWYLTEIASMDRTDVISLKYKTYEDFYTKHSFEPRSYLLSYQYDSSEPNSRIWLDENGLWGNGDPEITCETGSYELEMDYCPQYLDSILFSGGNVAFDYIKNPIEYIPRKSYPWILKHFTVKSIPPASSSNTEIFRCTLNDTLRTRDRRNLLKEVVLTDRGGAPIESYSFTYIGEGTRAMTPNSKDLFGYYNGALNGGTAFLRLFTSSYFSESIANRNYDPSSVSTLSLETISTASGAKTEFVYEGNSITTNYYGALFSTIGIGHRIHRINTYDLSGGYETLVRKRDFSYSSPGITVPEYAFVLGSFVTVNEVFREDLLEWSPSWTVKAGWHGMARSAIVVFNDQSVIPGVPLESARIFYGNVTERVSGPDFNSPSVRTDYVFDTSEAVHEYSGASWSLGVANDNHDNSHNTPGYHRYHFFQRPPYSVPRMGFSQSVDFTPNLSYFIPGDLPQLTSPTVIRRYKSNGYSDTLVSETVNEYELNDQKITTGYRVKNMIAFGDEDYLDDEWDMDDFFRTNIEHKFIWYRLKKTTETEWLDDGSAQMSVTTYSYLPTSEWEHFIPQMGSVLTPKNKTVVFSTSDNTDIRTYSWNYVYPTEIAANVPWASQIVSRGNRQAITETITAGIGNGSASTIRSVTWNAFTPKDAPSMTIYRPSSVTMSRREPGMSTFTNVGPNVYYEAYDSHGNVLQVKQDDEKPVSYIWGYGGLRPVLEVTGGTYDQVQSKVGSSIMPAIILGTMTSSQMANARSSLESSSNPYMLVSWYLYDMPLGMSQASDVSGRLTKYEYDGAGRLTTIRDENDNRVNSYTYALTNGGNGSPNSISSITHTAAGSSATAGVRDVSYFDGLGRTVQTVAVNASTAANGSSILRDLVTPFVPDFLDREDAKVYIPYPASTTTTNAGSFRGNSLSLQQSYHGNGVKAYTENIYEVSDRNRVIGSSLPGFTEMTTIGTSESPANTVLNLSYNASTKKITANGYYANGRFVRTVTEAPDGSHKEVYTDELGTFLERQLLDTLGTMADTYYIKDVLGRVLCVVPPNQSVLLNSTIINFATDSCYTYEYDGRDRVMIRQTPGSVEETITYNDMNLPITRTRKVADGSFNDEVFTTTYDGFNRPVLETYKYGSNSAITLTEYWYDTYPSGAPSFSAETGYVTVSDKDPRTRGLKTAERFTLLPAGVAPSAMNTSNTSTKEFRAFYYDAKGRIRQVAKTNTQGGTDRISSSYSFAGNLLKERQKIQPGSGQTFHTLDRTYTYDACLRLCSISASLDGGATATQGITYDDLQRTHTINRGNGTEITSLLYTLQGWLSSATSTSWEETLRYASPFHSIDPLPGKTGLITEWKQQQKGTSSNGSTTAETYTYSYDKAGRLTGSLRYIGTSSSSVNTLTERSITYDRSGYLLTLDRYGDSSETSPTESLSYTYTGPKRNTWTYDAHGNVTTDHQAGLGIAWNAIGLPRTITASAGTGSATTQRFYLADGTLAQVSDGTTTRLYLGDMVFDKAANGTVTLESAGWEGGRLLPGMGTDKVLYVVTDHLGSVRVVKDGMGVIRQRFDYYPYGTVSRTWASSVTTDDSEKRFRFGGKEVAGSALTDLTGMGSSPGAPYLDYGARLYSPGTATWLSQDPLSEKYYGIGPNVYCAGNPVNLVDPDGRMPQVVAGAVIGGVVGGIAGGFFAYIDGKRGREFWGAVGGGAVSGAIIGATGGVALFGEGVGAAVLEGTVTGAIGSATGSVTEQLIVDQSVDLEKVAYDTASGAIAGAASGFVKGEVIEKVESRVTTAIEEKYASKETMTAVRNEVKNELKNTGQTTGYRNRTLIDNRTTSRVNTMKSAEEYLVNKTASAVNKTQTQVNNWWIGNVGTNLYEQYGH